jgi:phage-related protein
MMPLVTVVISLIEQLLPVLGTPAATVTLIETIIGALTKILPLLNEFVPVVYNSVKNIIIEVKADPATTTSQWDVLDAIDKQLDAANDAAIAAVDPDA